MRRMEKLVHQYLNPYKINNLMDFCHEVFDD